MKYQPLTKNTYTSHSCHVTKKNKWSKFKEEDKDNFFIHPGEINATSGIFNFKENGFIDMDFFISNKLGDIQFTIKKNAIKLKEFILTNQHPYHLNIAINKGDIVEIIADKHGSTNSDWGRFTIHFEKGLFTYFKNLMVPLLWVILFVFLLSKKYTFFALSTYILFLLFVASEKLNFTTLDINNILTYMSIAFFITFVFIWIYQESLSLKTVKVSFISNLFLAFFVMLIPLIFMIYKLNFNLPVNKDILFAIFQSNGEESYEYIVNFISPPYIFLFLFLLSLVTFLLYFQEKKDPIPISRATLLFFLIAFSILPIMLFSQLKLPSYFLKNFHQYTIELQRFKQVQQQRKTGKIDYDASKKEKGETYIVIIGESLNKNHMGLYGYFRDTTPHLSTLATKNDLLIFNNVYSNHTHTVPVLSLSLTQANQYNHKEYYSSLSILDILNKADIDTYWISNQSMYGLWDNMVSVLAHQAKHLISLNVSIGTEIRPQKYDAALIPKIKKALEEKTNQTKVIFVHLYGNHHAYYNRYPHKTFTKYNKALKISEFGENILKNNQVNHYDNSVVYNDYVVSSILTLLQKEQGVRGLIYMSDHADDAIRAKGHSCDRFTYDMSQIPMIMWFSNSYQKIYANQYHTLLKHKEKLYSNDMFYNTLIGIFNIQTTQYNPAYDLSSTHYTLKPKDALILHGQKHYIDEKNHIYWQTENAKYLLKSHQSSRIFPSHVYYIKKLKKLEYLGFKSFEIDVQWKNNHLEILDNNISTSMHLETFLSNTNLSALEKIWIDCQNIHQENAQKILKLLQHLDKKFTLKHKVILSTDTNESFLNIFHQNQWHTSYRIHETTIDALTQENKQKYSRKISEQIRAQGLSSLSFTSKLYPFIKHFIEPFIPNNISYHITDGPTLHSMQFQTDLHKEAYYQDKRVTIILSP